MNWIEPRLRLNFSWFRCGGARCTLWMRAALPLGATLLAALGSGAAVHAQNPRTAQPALAPFAAAGTTTLQPPWKIEPFPGSADKRPAQFRIEAVDGTQALRIAADDAYGVLAHPWRGAAPGQLSWRWRLDQPLESADIATKAGDDNALKVCAMFDQPLGEMPFFERAALQLARATTSAELPAATVCYLWDSRYPAGRSGQNPYSARVRYLVLRGPEAPLARWQDESRDVAADFKKLFGDESPQVPPLLAVVVGADSDNTHGSSVGYVTALKWK